MDIRLFVSCLAKALTEGALGTLLAPFGLRWLPNGSMRHPGWALRRRTLPQGLAGASGALPRASSLGIERHLFPCQKGVDGGWPP